jgi:hypothetical protein
MKYILSILGALSISSSMLVAGVANITFGSNIELGGGQFYGADGLAADSVTVGYFTGDTFSANQTGWNALGSNSAASFGGVFSSTIANSDTTAGNGLTAYLLIEDNGLTGFVNLTSWASLSGTTAPALPAALEYTIGGSVTASGVNAFNGSGTVTVTDGQGTNFAGGFSGSGVSINIVPEPSAYALLGGLLALTCVMLRRRA